MSRGSHIILLLSIMGAMALITYATNLSRLELLTSVRSVDEVTVDTKVHMALGDNSRSDNYEYTSSDLYVKPFRNIESMAQARNYTIAPVHSNSIHTSQYTIRMNTWRRNEQLLISINHYTKCDGVAKIQIIWCDMDNEPPVEVTNHVSGKVVVERHTINSLNERYNITTHTPTLGILSMDDDILRPCEALDATFIRWTRHPERIVGFYARSHLPASGIPRRNRWTYNHVLPGMNNYSITLPSKMCFIHRDYLDLYVATLPRPIYQYIDTNFNCEDISMSYFVSALTGGRPPLLGDHWATILIGRELYSGDGLSGKNKHMVS